MSDTQISPAVSLSDNPLVNPPALLHGAPPLDVIRTEHFLPAIRWGIEKYRQEVAYIRDRQEEPTFQNTIEALEFAGEDLRRISRIYGHFCNANTSEALQEIQETATVEMTRLENDIALDGKLFARVKAVYEKRDQLSLTEEQPKILEDAYQGFVDGGAELPPEQKERFRAIDEKLATLKTEFEQNTIKASEAYQRIVTDAAELAGVPERAKEAYRAQAKEKGLAEGSFLILLEPYPEEIMTHCSNRALRKEVSRAYSGVCYRDAFDNSANMMEITRLSHEKAQLLGYPTFADWMQSGSMVGSVKGVRDFLEENLKVYKPAAEAEMAELIESAQKQPDAPAELKPWDVPYYSRLLQEQKFNFSTEETRPYFDLEKVLQGAWKHAEKLFNIEVREETTGKYPVYNPDVRTFEVYDKATNEQIGVLYCDYFARAGNKAGGAWMDTFRDRGVEGGEDKIPLVHNNCNFPKPPSGKPALLSIDDVAYTLIHEFGHGLNALLAVGRYPSHTGIRMKEWDGVELPSQLMQSWFFEPSVLKEFALHQENKKPIPDEMIQKIKDSRNFQAGMIGLRQTFLGLLDLEWGTQMPQSPEHLENEVAARATVMKREAGMMSASFTHIFSGEYGGGYYSGYKKTEVMADNIFERFQEQGLYDRGLAVQLREIYAKSGWVSPMTLYKGMMGCEPNSDATFRREGLLPGRGMQGLKGAAAQGTAPG